MTDRSRTFFSRLPASLPVVDFVPRGSTEHGAPGHWFDWNLATAAWQSGFDPKTGMPVHERERIVLAPYAEFRDAVKLDKATPFQQVVAVANARAGTDKANALGGPQAVLQASDGAWLVASAGAWETSDHIEPINLDLYPKGTEVRRAVRELKALVGRTTWVDFTGSGAA